MWYNTFLTALVSTAILGGAVPAGTPDAGAEAVPPMRPVDAQAPARGSYLNVFPETDRYQRTFGEEYLYALHQSWRRQDAAKPPVIFLDGDSTIAGAYITDGAYLPQNMLLTQLRLRGFDAAITNLAVSGTTIAQFHLSDANITAAQCIIISFWINDTEPVDEFIKNYRAKLAHIRSLRSYLQTAVVLKISNALGDTTHKRDETQAWPQRQALRQAARDYQCFYFDTAGYLADARNGASGTWNDSVKPSTPVTPGWMDDPFRTDPNFYDPLSFGNTVHPLELANAWIWGRLADALAVPGVRNFAFNNFQNLGALQQRSCAELPPTYPYGISVNRAAAGTAAWPLDGMVMTVRSPDGMAVQYLTAADANGSPLSIRTGGAGGMGWGAWSSVGGHRGKAPVVFLSPQFQNSWADGASDGGARIVMRDDVVYFQGNLSGGALIPGTRLFTLPEGWRPFNEVTTVACVGGTARDEWVVLLVHKNGDVILQKPPKTAHLYLDGVSFVTRAGLF
jgi:hypothetical protein